ncbi:MAG: hypothetical protein P0116_05240 [Candidatus Nitrosocosmicus sp.]|nr:hypothetical protein [Candidatus Nitrosocosmicus sp.]
MLESSNTTNTGNVSQASGVLQPLHKFNNSIKIQEMAQSVVRQLQAVLRIRNWRASSSSSSSNDDDDDSSSSSSSSNRQ